MADFGILSLLLTISAFLLYVFTLGSFQFLFKSVNEGAEECKSALWASAILTAGIGLVGVLITYLFIYPISKVLGLTGYEDELLLIVLVSATTSVMTVFLYYHYGFGRNNFQNFLQFLRGSLWVIVAIVISLLFDLNLKNTLWIINGSMIFILLLSIPWSELKLLTEIKVNHINFSKLFAYCIPLLPYFAGVWGIPMIIRTQLNIYDGAKNVAIFSVAYTLMEIVFMFISTITATLSPYFFAETENNQKPGLFYNIMLKYSIVSIVLIVPFVFMLRNDIILLVASEKYLVASKYIPLLIFFPLLRVLIIVFEQYLLKHSQTLYLGAVYALGMLVSFILAIILIPRFSIYGAITASLTAYLCVFISLFIKQRKIVDVEYLRFPAIIGVALILWATVFALGLLNVSNWLKIVPLGIAAFACVYFLPVFNEQEKDKLMLLLKLKK